jgi:hypothetical protein
MALSMYQSSEYQYVIASILAAQSVAINLLNVLIKLEIVRVVKSASGGDGRRERQNRRWWRMIAFEEMTCWR